MEPFPRYGTVLRSWYLDQVEADSSTARYISRSCRRNTYGPDHCLSWIDETERNLALACRAGAFSRNARCTNGHQFTRRCINECGLLDRFRPLRNANLRFRRPRQVPEHYNKLDMYLNAEWREDFVTAINWLLGIIQD